MAVNETVGIDFLLKADTNTIGGKEDATLNLERASSQLAPTQGAGSNYARRLAGLQDWSIDFDALWLINSDAESGFSPTITVAPSASSPPDLKYVSEVSITLERELIEFANDQHTQYIARGPSMVMASLDITTDVEAAEWYGSGNASKLLVDAWESTDGKEDVKLALPSGSTDFEATYVVSDIGFATPTDDATEVTYTLESDGTITENVNANLGSGLDTLVTNVLSSSPSNLTALIETGTTGDVEFSGDVLVEELEITIPVEGAEEGVTTSGTLTGADSLTIQES